MFLILYLMQNMIIDYVSFFSPFIQLLGDLDEIRKNAEAYIDIKRESYDHTQQNAKLGNWKNESLAVFSRKSALDLRIMLWII